MNEEFKQKIAADLTNKELINILFDLDIDKLDKFISTLEYVDTFIPLSEKQSRSLMVAKLIVETRNKPKVSKKEIIENSTPESNFDLSNFIIMTAG